MYLRTTRGAWPVLYPAGEAFPVGGSKVLRAASGDDVTLIGAGVTVHQCLRAAGVLAADGITARVIDLYSVKPADQATLADAAAATGGRRAAGGLPGSGTPEELMDAAGISASRIATAARDLLKD